METSSPALNRIFFRLRIIESQSNDLLILNLVTVTLLLLVTVFTLPSSKHETTIPVSATRYSFGIYVALQVFLLDRLHELVTEYRMPAVVVSGILSIS